LKLLQQGCVKCNQFYVLLFPYYSTFLKRKKKFKKAKNFDLVFTNYFFQFRINQIVFCTIKGSKRHYKKIKEKLGKEETKNWKQIGSSDILPMILNVEQIHN
jgi:ABC-type uncharacterized transport system permease subunit